MAGEEIGATATALATDDELWLDKNSVSLIVKLPPTLYVCGRLCDGEMEEGPVPSPKSIFNPVTASGLQVGVAVTVRAAVPLVGVTSREHGGPVTLTTAVAMLLARLGSDSMPETFAVALIVPELLGNMVNVADIAPSLTARLPSGQLMFVSGPLLVEVQVFGDKLTTVLFGIVAVKVMPLALRGPAFVTLSE